MNNTDPNKHTRGEPKVPVKGNNTDPNKHTRGEPKVPVKGKQFLLLTRHPPCYSYNPVKDSVIEFNP